MMTAAGHASPQPPPLEGVRVLDLTRLLPGAVCTMMMVDLGAEVIKIEDPNGGDYARWYAPQHQGQSVFFRMNNRSKQSVILDLKTADGQKVLHRLVESADVLVESFRPNVMARLGCDYATLANINPKLIYCSISGWGATGPDAHRSGHDLNFVAKSGLLGMMSTPQPLGGQVADIGGAYLGMTGILAALFRRERTGIGAQLDISLSESALPYVLYNWVEAQKLEAAAGEGVLTGGLACYGIYQTVDGQAVALAALEPKFWQNFCDAINRPDLIDYHLQPPSQAYLQRELASIFAQQTADAWDAQLSGVDCCYTRVNTAETLAQDPHYQARGMLGTFPDGVPWMRSPIHFSNDAAPEIANQSPDYGEHTDAVLRAAGYTDADLALLRDAGAIR